MKSSTSVLAVFVAAATWLAPGVFGQASDVNQVLADMRAAAGGADRIAAVRTFSAEGTIQRVTPRGTVERTVEIAMALPDKYVARTQLTDQGNMSVYRRLGLNGDGLINETDAPPNLAAAGVNRRLLTDRPLTPPTPEAQEEANQRLLMNARAEFARLTLAMFGSSYDGAPVELSYAGLAESPDGTAHAINATGAWGFDVRLFVDSTTHRPLMMIWSQALPRDPATTQEHRLYYSNFNEVGGLTLPYTIRHAVDGNVTDETTYAEISINPEIDMERFAISR